MTVSRIIQKAREDELVRIDVKLPFKTDDSLGKRLTGLYGLKNAVIVKTA
jgi:DNA-binding transcriptional regulator LsrR (DeoR family)